jgi:hypothetical protein
VCHELRTWRNLAREKESRRDLWQEFEDSTRRAEESRVEPPEPAEPERSEETVSARA